MRRSALTVLLPFLGACTSTLTSAPTAPGPVPSSSAATTPPAAAPSAPSAAGSAAPSIEGTWEGTLKAGAVELRVVFNVRKSGDKWTATMDSPDQGAEGVPVDEVRLDGQKVTISVRAAQGRYEGVLAGETITGTLTQGKSALPLTLAKTDHRTTIGPRPQEPQHPYPYDSVEVTVDSPKGNAKLACTLTVPRSKGPFPAVSLITGSGPQDRDEQLFGHKPFLVIADALTQRGIAVLRCDDRGVARSTGAFGLATTYDFVDDALAEVAFLRARPEIDARHVGLVGHSEGGSVAPIAAAQSKDVAFVVMLAGMGVPGDELLYLQNAAMMKVAGQSDADIRRRIELLRKQFAIASTEKNYAAVAKELQALQEALPENERPKPRDAVMQLTATLEFLTSPWGRAFLSFDPRPHLKKVKVPVLALNGERDLQVPPKENLREIAAALKGNRDATVKELPELNHLFQHCKTGAPTEYGRIDETFSPAALELVGDFILKRAR
jgi:uncharacterized protein